MRNKIAMLTLGLFLAGSGWSAVQAAESDDVAYAGVPVAVTTDKSESEAQRKRGHCIRETGTRIRQHAGRTCDRPGRRYTRDEVWRRGEIDLGEALIKTDPALDGGKRW